MNTHLQFLLAYSVLLVAIGLWLSRRVRGAADFFVAGRRLGSGRLAATLLAANIGAGSTVGAAALGYRDGFSAWWWVGSAGIGSLVLAFWIGPAIRRQAERYDHRTVGDFLEHRYGPSVRATIAGLLWIGTLAILAGQLIALARLLEVVAGVPKPIGCLIGGAVMTTYFAAGGLLTSAAVNIVQLVVLLAGFLVVAPIVVGKVGGVAALGAVAPAGDYWSFWRGGGSGWPYLAMLAPAFMVSPGLVQKVYGARDDRSVKVGVAVNGIVLLLFAFVPPLLGISARALHGDLAHQDLALPTLLVEDLPVALGSLGLAALFSAEVSTADAILFMLATSLSQDLYRRFLNPGADDRRVLQVARYAAVAGGTFGVLLAIAAESVIDTLAVFYSVLTVSLGVPLVAGLYTRTAGVAAALASIAAGMTAMAGTHAASAGRGFGALTPTLVGLMAAAVVFFAVSRFSNRALEIDDCGFRD